MSLCVLLSLLLVPLLRADDADLAQDAFPANGSLLTDTAAHRDALDVAFSMARDVVPGLGNCAGDSILVTITPGAAPILDARLHWVLEKNPFFEDALRQVPSRVEDIVVDSTDPKRWTGQARGAPPFYVNGQPFQDLWAFDLPDVDFLYPGDVLRYCIVARDESGSMASLPADTTGLATGTGYDPGFVVRALPTLVDASGQQPSTLAVLGTGDRQARELVETSLAQAGYRVGVDLDLYYERAPAQFVGNGIGSAGQHGASVTQLAGYRRLLFFFGARDTGILSDETRVGSNDESDDFRRLVQWRAQPGLRAVAWFGDSVFSGLLDSSPQGVSAVTNDLSIVVHGFQLGEALDGQTHVEVQSEFAALAVPWVVDRSSPSPAALDDFEALGVAFPTHLYTDPRGVAYPGFAAAVLHDRQDASGDRKIDVAFGCALQRMSTVQEPGSSTVPSRARLLRQIRDYFGDPTPSISTATTAAASLTLETWPNPAHGTAFIRFSGGETLGTLDLRVFDSRGRLLRNARWGPSKGGTWIWDGRDRAGRPVSRGVYLVELRAAGARAVRAIVLR